ncbi:Anosmin-1 [Schistosoma japonicum]|uniref:Anosmin-1 n=1 Tax=Schistosoma japonicum TaxID=6182 RepID=A0A4Z2DNK3_SCHJA|nr:Anosmin-1 [Schistosoma japonicum]
MIQLSYHKNYQIILLIINFLLCDGDFMDLISESICAAKCLKAFTNSLSEQDKTFLKQRPDLTQPHCINQENKCALCLEICKWPRSQTTDCPTSCQKYTSMSNSNEIVNSHSATLPSTSSSSSISSSSLSSGDKHESQSIKSTCLNACYTAQQVFSQSDQLQNNPNDAFCPKLDTWPESCQYMCENNVDCLPYGYTKCCQTTKCYVNSHKKGLIDSVKNYTKIGICSQGVYNPQTTPPVPGKPIVKQVENVFLPHSNRKFNTNLDRSNLLSHGQHNQLELDWPDYYNSSNIEHNPIIFLIQLRMYSTVQTLNSPLHTTNSEFHFPLNNLMETSQPNEYYFDKWTNLIWTTKLGAVLSDLNPGTWYQFRLLAVSSEGFGGWGEPSEPIRTQVQLIPPSRPQNLTEIRSRIFENHVDSTIHWEVPEQIVFPLKKYQITWRQYYAFNGEDKSSLTEYTANVPGDKTMYLIQNLKPGTTYKIEVKAVSLFEGVEIKSHPATLYISTIQIPSQQIDTVLTSSMSTNESCMCSDSKRDYLTITDQYYENQQLNVILSLNVKINREQFGLTNPQTDIIYTIEWIPKVCIETQNQTNTGFIGIQRKRLAEHELRNILLTDLQFQCHYEASVFITANHNHTTSTPNMSGQTRNNNISPILFKWTTCFCTPACQNVVIKDGLTPKHCYLQTSSSILQPIELTYTLFSNESPRELHRLKPNQMDELIIVSETSFPHLTKETNIESNLDSINYTAIVTWHPITSPVHSKSESKRSSRTLRNRTPSMKITNPEIRSVRLTWGPRLYEPIGYEVYSNIIQPLMDPEKTQSKVVDLNVPGLQLKGLKQETLYIVQAQMINEKEDGPISTIYFMTPTKKNSLRNVQSVQTKNMNLICIIILFQLIYNLE